MRLVFTIYNPHKTPRVFKWVNLPDEQTGIKIAASVADLELHPGGRYSCYLDGRPTVLEYLAKNAIKFVDTNEYYTINGRFYHRTEGNNVR